MDFCLQRASPGIKEMLLKLHRSENPLKIDHNIYESSCVHYNIKTSDSEDKIIYLSVSSLPLCPVVPPATSLRFTTIQCIRRHFSAVAQVIEPPMEEFQLTLRIDFAKLPHKKKDCIKVITEIASIQCLILSSQLRDTLCDIGSPHSSLEMFKPVKLVYHPGDPFFVIKMADKISAIFPMRFKDDSDVILATVFFQELMDAECSSNWKEAPPCTWSPIPPPELRGEPLNELSTNAGFVSFDVFPRHVKGEKLEKTVWCLLNFHSYVKNYVKCTRGFIHRRLRKQLTSLAEVMVKAIEGGEEEDQTKSSGCRYLKNFAALSKTKILGRKCGHLRKKIMRIRSPIKVRAFAQSRKKWFKLPHFTSLGKYSKLD